MFKILEAYEYGAIDSKLIDSDLIKKKKVWIISSPTTENGNPPFSFTGKWANLPHYGMPITYNFDWILYNFNVELNA
jgi:hypothetical protein